MNVGESSNTLIARIAQIEKNTKGTNKLIQQLLGGGGEGSIICNKGYRLQVDHLKDQVQPLHTKVSMFKLCLNRLTSITIE